MGYLSEGLSQVFHRYGGDDFERNKTHVSASRIILCQMDKVLSAQLQYIDDNHLSLYFEDSVKLFLEAKDCNPHINATKHFLEYFQKMSKGTHILNREYAFIIATQYNRECFINQVKKIFASFYENESLKLLEYYEILQLICPDFPSEIINKLPLLDSPITPKQFLNIFQEDFARDK